MEIILVSVMSIPLTFSYIFCLEGLHMLDITDIDCLLLVNGKEQIPLRGMLWKTVCSMFRLFNVFELVHIFSTGVRMLI